MEIRQMKKEEAEEISKIYASSWKSAYKGIVPQVYLDKLPEDKWVPILSKNPDRSYILIENGQYIGTSSIDAARDETMNGWGEILSIYFKPEYYGKGYGKELLSFCIEKLLVKGFDKIYLWTLEKNLYAIRFYEKSGFFPNGDKTDCEIGGEKLTLLKYVYYAMDRTG